MRPQLAPVQVCGPGGLVQQTALVVCLEEVPLSVPVLDQAQQLRQQALELLLQAQALEQLAVRGAR